MRFETALITGASRGLGLALARQLSAQGVRVAGVARNAEIESAMADLPGAHAIVADVADPAEAARLVGRANAAMGPIDLLVHNASTLGAVPLPLLADMTPSAFEAAFQTNVLGAFRVTRLVVGSMILRGRGMIACISSDAAVTAWPNWGAYGASKAALDHMARTLTVELQGTGVRVLSFDPGEMDTRMHADAMPGADRAALQRPDDVAARLVALLAAS